MRNSSYVVIKTEYNKQKISIAKWSLISQEDRLELILKDRIEFYLGGRRMNSFESIKRLGQVNGYAIEFLWYVQIAKERSGRGARRRSAGGLGSRFRFGGGF